MVITRTPFRVSFVGGGTDFRGYYSKYEGMVVSTTIDKYIYVTVTQKFDGKIHLRYSRIEEVNDVNSLEHALIREAMKFAKVTSGVEIVIISDIPTHGSGLGSSSTLAVGVLNALFVYKGCYLDGRKLAELACCLEIDILGAPIGCQDQYASAIGGFNKFTFYGSNKVDSIDMYSEGDILRIRDLESSCLLFYLGYSRSANSILSEHKDGMEKNIEYLNKQKELAEYFCEWLEGETTVLPAKILNLGWELKKKICSKTSSEEIDSIVDLVRKISDEVGVKVVGAGGGGFMLVYCPRIYQNILRGILKDLYELPFKFSLGGSKVIFNG